MHSRTVAQPILWSRSKWEKRTKWLDCRWNKPQHKARPWNLVSHLRQLPSVFLFRLFCLPLMRSLFKALHLAVIPFTLAASLVFLDALPPGFSSPSSPHLAFLFLLTISGLVPLCGLNTWHHFHSVPPSLHFHTKPISLTMATLHTKCSTSLSHVQGHCQSKTDPTSTISHPGSGLPSYVLPASNYHHFPVPMMILVFFLNLMLPHLLENF